jgi:hypothetical protein
MRPVVNKHAIVLISAFVGFLADGSLMYAQRPAATVIIDEMTTTEIQAAVAHGKTTLVLMFGGLHENSYSVQDALAYYAFPYEPNENGHKSIAGTVNLRDSTLIALVEDIANSAISNAHFKNVVVIGNHGGGEVALKKAAEGLDAQWTSKGVRVFYFPVYDLSKKELSRYVASQKDANLPPECQTGQFGACIVAIDDFAKMLFLDKRHVRIEKAPPSLAKFIQTPGLGKTIVEQYVTLAVEQIRKAVPATKTTR